MKYVNYSIKDTNSGNNYYDINPHCWNDLRQELMYWLVLFTSLDTLSKPETTALKEWARKRNSNLPKGMYGTNTPQTFISGIVENTVYGDQRDLSELQARGIEYISKRIAAAFPTKVESIKFNEKVDFF